MAIAPFFDWNRINLSGGPSSYLLSVSFLKEEEPLQTSGGISPHLCTIFRLLLFLEMNKHK